MATQTGTPFMNLLIALSGLASAAGLSGALWGGWFADVPLYVAVAGVLMTGALVLSRGVGPFLRFFIAFYAMGASPHSVGEIDPQTARGVSGVCFLLTSPEVNSRDYEHRIGGFNFRHWKRGL